MEERERMWGEGGECGREERERERGMEMASEPETSFGALSFYLTVVYLAFTLST